MNLRLSILMVALAILAEASPTDSAGQPQIIVDPNQDPAIIAQCFSTYLPLLQNVSNSFSTQYQACVTEANDQINVVVASAQSTRTQFTKDTDAICAGFQTCQNEMDLLTFFACYSSASFQDVSQVYALSNNAATAASTLSQGLKNIQVTQETCTNNTERTFVADTAETYQKLDTCLQCGLPVSTGPVTTEKTDTTDAAATTEVAQTLEAAESTETDDEIRKSAEISTSTLLKLQIARAYQITNKSKIY